MSVEGVTEAKVSLSEKTAVVTAEAGTSSDAVIAAIGASGQYTAELVDQPDKDD